MKHHVRKAAAALCVTSVLLSAASCDLSFLNRTKETEAEASYTEDDCRSMTMSLWNELTAGMKERDKDRVRSVFSDAEDLDLIDLPGKSDEEIRIIEDIAGTVTGEFSGCDIDEANVCRATVKVTVADYESVLSDAENITDVDTLEDAILSAPLREFTTDVVVNIESADVYHIANYNGIMEDVYGFFDLELEFIPQETSETSETETSGTSSGADAVSIEWSDTYSDHLYVNTDRIQADAVLDEATDGAGINYVIEYNGENVAQGTGTSAVYDITAGECDTTYQDCLAAGEYRISFYSGDGSVLHTDSVTVSIVTRTEITASDVQGIIWNGTDDDMAEADGNAVYTNTDSLDLEIVYDHALCDVSGVYYVVTLGGDALYTSPSGESRCTYGIEDGAETYYNGHMVQGEYTITFFNGTGEMIASANCSVMIER